MYINLYTGTGGSQTITNGSPTNAAGFQSSFQWFKCRSTATDHVVHDVLRGPSGLYRLFPNLTRNEQTTGDGFLSINSNGFSLDSSGSGGDVNTNGRTYVAWQWAGPSSGTTNTNGSVTTSVAANTTSGFSVVTYTANGSQSTIGHGLGAAPQFIFTRSRSVNGEIWVAYHVSLGVQYYTILNSDAASANNLANYWGSSAPTSTTYTIGPYGAFNTNGATYVAYCWAAVAGFSSFGKYTGNGSSDGPFMYCGFRPRFILVKSTSGSRNWYIWDTSRNTFNVMDLSLYPNSTTSEITASDLSFDSVSNGFKARGTSIGINNNGETYLYAAFAENPFKYALAR
jgi:hypothetical protein